MAVNPETLDFNPGAHPSRPDDRDHQWTEVGAGVAPFDWNTGYDVEAELSLSLSPKDQGSSSSCGGQAWSMAAAVLEAVATKSLEERSAKFIYSQTFVPGGGSAGRENSNIYVKQGCARETVLSSYENGNAPTEAFMERSGDITDAIRQDATSDKAISYANVATDIDSLAQAMQANHGVIIGLDGSNNGTWLSVYPNPPQSSDTNIWQHWLYAGKAKMINGKKYIAVLNSWGMNVGDRGWQWLSEDYIATIVTLARFGITRQVVWEAWTLVYNPQPVPSGFTHDFTQDIPYGSHSDEVLALQKALQLDGEFPASIAPTGYYGNITRRAVYAFQIKYQVAPLAELNALAGRNVGTLTRAQLNQLFNH